MAKNTRRSRWRDKDSKTLVQRFVFAQVYLTWFDHASRVAALDLELEEDVQWSELIDQGWNKWPAKKLQQRWADLKKKVDVSATHRSE
jgi:hypothetical protein